MAPLCADVALRFLFRPCLLVFACSLSVGALLWLGAWLLSFFALAVDVTANAWVLTCAAYMLPARCICRLLLLTKSSNLFGLVCDCYTGAFCTGASILLALRTPSTNSCHRTRAAICCGFLPSYRTTRCLLLAMFVLALTRCGQGLCRHCWSDARTTVLDTYS